MPLFPPHRCRALCLLVALAAAGRGIGVASADGPAATGVVVLRNGNVLAGTIRQTGGHYVIEQTGTSFQVPAEQVEMACGSLAEAYELRRRDRAGGSADAHLELARWCLRNDLLDQAAREALDARTRDPGHPSLPMVDAQIRQAAAIERERVERRASPARPTSPPTPPVVTVPAIAAAATAAPSTEAQVQFVRSIQPMLIHGCATGGCHQPSAPQTMQLDRRALDGNGSPELIRRNLEAILTQIDRGDPASSPLLLRARQVHGPSQGAKSRALASYQTALLSEWLNAVCGIAATPPLEETPGGGLPSERAAGDSGAAQSPTPAFAPRDAFDPAIFNRQSAAPQPTTEPAAAR